MLSHDEISKEPFPTETKTIVTGENVSLVVKLAQAHFFRQMALVRDWQSNFRLGWPKQDRTNFIDQWAYGFKSTILISREEN